MYEQAQNGSSKIWGSPLSKHIPTMELALKIFNTHPFEKETLMESVNEIKKVIYNI